MQWLNHLIDDLPKSLGKLPKSSRGRLDSEREINSNLKRAASVAVRWFTQRFEQIFDQIDFFPP